MKSKGLNLCIKVILVFLLLFSLFAPHSLSDSYFDIKSYSTDVSISESNIYTVKDTVTVYFHKPYQEFIKKLPLKSGDFIHSLSNISVADKNGNEYSYKSLPTNDYMELHISSGDIPFTGAKELIISYTYDMGEDSFKTMDSVSWDIIKSEWNCNIYSVNFNIQFPKSLNYSKINIATKDTLNYDDSRVIWDVYDNVIIGKLLSNLEPFEKLTLLANLSEGYFVGATKGPTNIVPYILLSLIILTIIFTTFTFIEYKISTKPINTSDVIFPPSNINCVEFKYLATHHLDFHDVPALIISWANSGFLRIEKKLKKSSLNFKKYEFELSKLSDIVTENEQEVEFFNKLLPSEDSIQKEPKRAKKSFYNLSYSFIKGMVKQIKLSYNPFNSLFNLRVYLIRIASFGLLFLVITDFFYVVTSKPLLSLFISFLFSILIQWIVFYFLEFKDFTIQSLKSNNLLKYTVKLVIIFVILISAIIILAITIFNSLPLTKLMGSEVSGRIFISYIFVYPFLSLFTSKTFRYNKSSGDFISQLVSFKNFISNMNKEQADVAIKSNPDYFYTMLPYAMNLKVCEKFSDKFKDTITTFPAWYSSEESNEFVMKSFIYDMIELLNELQHLEL